MYRKLIISIFLIFFIITPTSADTVYLKDGTETKGIVVENYHDRLLISTIDGEKEIEKQHIKDIGYDRPEQNLVKMGDMALQKDNPAKALEYFEKACRLNPDYKEAKDKFFHLRSDLLRLPEQKIESDIDRKRSLFLQSGKIYKPEKNKRAPKTLEDRFKEAVGLALAFDSEMPRVKAVVPGSPAYKAGMRSGDIIVSVWGRLTGYLDPSNIMEMILDSASTEINMVAKRDIKITADVNKYSSIEKLGFLTDINEEGIFISSIEENSLASEKGLLEGDIITDIGTEKTRYMPLDKAVKLINNQAVNGRIELSILRDIIIWKKG